MLSKKTISLWGFILGLLFLLTNCNSSPQNQQVLNVGMLLAKGGLGDRSFNDSAYAGLQAAQQKYAIRFKTIDFTTDEANLDGLRNFAREKYDLIIGVGFDTTNYIKTVSAEFPESKFVLIDVPLEAPNVVAITYREQEGDFLMGVLAAMLTKNQHVGFIGGVDAPVIQRIKQGFEQGVAYQNKEVQVTAEIAGSFSDPDKGKSLALAQYDKGVDIIYNGAGRTGLGIIEAAKERNKLTLGTSGDQRYLAPGQVVGNRPKRVDTAVLTVIEQVLQNKFQHGVQSLGLKEGGLSLGPFDETLVSADMLAKLKDLENKIIQGEIVVKVE